MTATRPFLDEGLGLDWHWREGHRRGWRNGSADFVGGHPVQDVLFHEVELGRGDRALFFEL
jgi:hypothetical protein